MTLKIIIINKISSSGLLTCCSKMYQDCFQSDVVRHTAMERTVLKEQVYTHKSPGAGAQHDRQAAQEAAGSAWSKWEAWLGHLIVFLGEATGWPW